MDLSDASLPDSVVPEASVPATVSAFNEAGVMRAAGDCMKNHMLEAAALNESRKPGYSSRTQGKSEPISDKLIAGEKLAVPLAQDVDARALPYQERGIAIVCDDFIPMANTPPYRDTFPFVPQPLSAFHKTDAAAMVSALSAAYDKEGFAGVKEAAIHARESIESVPTYHCLVRHMLESTIRVATLAPLHDAKARDRGLSSTIPLSLHMLQLHLASMPDSADLDAEAAPLHAVGVPIICQDVPPIPPGP